MSEDTSEVKLFAWNTLWLIAEIGLSFAALLELYRFKIATHANFESVVVTMLVLLWVIMKKRG